MTAATIRKIQPESICCFLPYLLNGGTASFEQLVSALVTHDRTRTECRKIVENAIADGLLLYPKHKHPNQGDANPASPRRRTPEKLRLPYLNEINVLPNDAYCFECHLPGVLETCRRCPRAFHSYCTRQRAEKPLYKVPSAKSQKNRLPEFSSDSNATDTEHTDDDNNNENDLRTTSSLTLANSSISQQCITDDNMPLDEYEHTYEPKPLLDYNVEEKQEVLCVGEIRAPTRRRPATTASTVSYKSELAANDEQQLVDEAKYLCTCCRLLDTAALRNPANMQADELCHLLNYTFTRNRSWLKYDVISYLHAKKATKAEIEVICKLLFQAPVPSLNAIAEKLQEHRYNFLMEFLVDILDLQHSMGVFFGPDSMAYDSTKWLTRDIQHDIAEIRRCPDCYRYSSEKLSDLWFALPCVQRHELVYAKQTGFSFWPAKVIRVLANNKYDVRFFGTDHSRALIQARNIRPIDTNVKNLKLSKTTALRKAIEELRYHQQFSNIYAASDFSFYANPLEIVRKIQNVMGGNVLHVARGHRRRNTIMGGLPAATAEPVSPAAAEHTTPRRPNTALKRKIADRCKTAQPAAHLAHNSDNGVPLNLPADIHNDNSSAASSAILQCTPVNAGTAGTAERRRITRSATKASEPEPPQELVDVIKQHERALNVIDDFHRKLESQRKQIQALKSKIKTMEQQQNIIKRQPWCYWCLEPATYLCCIRATYCSTVCQARHWNDSHYKECKHKGTTQSRQIAKTAGNSKRIKQAAT